MTVYDNEMEKIQEGLHTIDNALALFFINEVRDTSVLDPDINLTGMYRYKVKNPYKEFMFVRELKTKVVTSQAVNREYLAVFRQSLKNLKRENIMFALQVVKVSTPLETFLLFINGYDSLIKNENEQVTENVN